MTNIDKQRAICDIITSIGAARTPVQRYFLKKCRCKNEPLVKKELDILRAMIRRVS